MQILRKEALPDSRRIRTAAYETHRFLLASDAAGATVTDIILRPGREETYGYDAHVEIAYCLEGAATLTDASGVAHAIAPGTMWVARPGERFRFVAQAPTRLICVFTPPLEGGETGFASDMMGEPA